MKSESLFIDMKENWIKNEFVILLRVYLHMVEYMLYFIYCVFMLYIITYSVTKKRDNKKS